MTGTLIPTLIYCYDPMCSWCWGFSPTWVKLQAALQRMVDAKQLTIQPLLGGLAVDSDAPMEDAMKNGLEATWKKIETTLGSEFNYNFWRTASPRRSTYPACRACYVARSEGLEKQMYNEIQKAYYLEAKNPSNLDTLTACAEKVGLKSEDFQKSMQYVQSEQLLESEIKQARRLGLNSFPSLALLIDDKIMHIQLDYKDHTSMLETIEKAIL